MMGLLAAFLAGAFASTPRATSSPGIGMTLLDVLRTETCMIPIVLMAVLLFFSLGIRLYYLAEKLQARIRQLRADADYAEAVARQRSAQVDDLTITSQGKVLPRLLKDRQGRLVLVDPELGTRPVVEVDAETMVDEDPRLRALALMGKANSGASVRSHPTAGPAAKAGGSGVGMGDMLTAAAYVAGGLGMESAQRLPQRVRVLTAEEAKELPDGEEA